MKAILNVLLLGGMALFSQGHGITRRDETGNELFPYVDVLTPGDIGNPGMEGSTTQMGNSFTMKGGGSEIWANSDSFHFASEQVAEFNAILVVKVASMDYHSANAGLMIRDSLEPNSKHVYVYLSGSSGSNGPSMKWRSSTGGMSDHRTEFAHMDSVWLKLEKQGNLFTGFWSADGNDWKQMYQQTVFMNNPIHIGLALSSNNKQLTTAELTDLSKLTFLPSGDIGNPEMKGSTIQVGNSFTMKGGGHAIWGSGDQFHFASRQVQETDVILVVKVVSFDHKQQEYAKVGLMIRDSLEPNSKHVSFVLTGAHGPSMQWRSSTGGFSSSVEEPDDVHMDSVWLKLEKQGNSFASFWSVDGIEWEQIDQPHTVVMNNPIHIGLAITSTNSKQLATAVLTDLSKLTFLPSGDIGNPEMKGSTIQVGNSFTMKGGGHAIWDSSDQFHFASRQVQETDVNFVVKVVSFDYKQQEYAKIGLMIRDSLEPNSKHVSFFLTGAHGPSMQWRSSTGGLSRSVEPLGHMDSVWLTLKKLGNSFACYWSADGIEWKQIGQPHTVVMNNPIHIGLAITSTNSKQLATAELTSFGTSAGNGNAYPVEAYR